MRRTHPRNKIEHSHDRRAIYVNEISENRELDWCGSCGLFWGVGDDLDDGISENEEHDESRSQVINIMTARFGVFFLRFIIIIELNRMGRCFRDFACSPCFLFESAKLAVETGVGHDGLTRQ